MFPPLPPASPRADEVTRAASSPLWRGSAGGTAECFFRDLARQESDEAQEADAAAREVHAGGANGSCDGGEQPQAAKSQWIELDPAAERQYLDDPLRSYTQQFCVDQENHDFADVNGPWLDRKMRSIAARAKLAESRMIRQLTKQLSAQ